MACMSNIPLVLILSFLLFNADAAINKAYECRLLADGDLIDLTPLSHHDNTPRFRDIPDAAGPSFLYSWNPCEPFTEGSICQGVELCQLSSTTDDAYVLGRGGNSRFVYESPQRIFFVYSILSDQGQTRETYIQLVCNASVDAQLVFQEENPPLIYHMILTSKYACPKPVPSNSTVSPTTSTASTVPPATTTLSPPFPIPTSSPRPNIFNLETITILLGCILLSLLFLIFLVFIGLITRR
ncbi:uncharacterized protein [Haliotis asinina]|uniref:uncharacterized protein n=1 Tax=Haliotis asinina TaxID=109174 RepID=UPI0035324A9E